jgi:hypothetical protein
MASTCYLSLPDDSAKIYLDEDPETYDDGPAERRMSSQETMGGGRVWQDFGVQDLDRTIRLKTGWMTQATLDAFKTKLAVLAQVWKWADHKGRSYLVVFRTINPERIRGYEAYRVEINFDVLQALS